MAELWHIAFVTSLLASMVRIAVPILYAALGELVTERSGIQNLGLEGMMLSGALVGFLGTYLTHSPWIGTLAAILAGSLCGLLMAFMACTLKVDQTITGLAINLVAAGFTSYGFRLAFKGAGLQNPPTIDAYPTAPIPLLSGIPLLGKILFSQHLLTYMALLMVPLVSIFLYRTRFGLELRGIGDSPRALDMKGVNLVRYQYLAVIFGGAMAGLGGGFLTLASTGIFLPGISAGRGWIALAIVIFGNWRPSWILLGALFFGLVDSFQLSLQALGVPLPYQLLLSLPYVLTILALIVNRHRLDRPLTLGRPYLRE